VSEAIFLRLSEILGSIVKPNHLMVVVSVASGAILFNAFQLQEYFRIEEQVQDYKLWIAITFFVSSGLQLLGIAKSASSWTWKHIVRVFGNVRAQKIELSDSAGWILVMMAASQPDSTRLLTRHTNVRELRLHKLIEPSSYYFVGSDYESFNITERGLSAALPRLRTLPHYTDRKVKELISVVTGVELQE
jgi:hypothetical protein